VRKEVVSPEVVFWQLPALQFQIPVWRRRSEKGGRLLPRVRLLSITCSPVPDSWEEVAGCGRRSSPSRRSSSVHYLLSSSRFLGGGSGVKEVVSSWEVVFCRLPALQFQIPGRRPWGKNEVVCSPEVVFCQLPALQFQIPGRRRWGEKGGRLLLGGRLQHLEDAHRRHPHGELCRSLKML
jgi:hypothetical protein